MTFYDLSKKERHILIKIINQDIAFDLSSNETENTIKYFSHKDTYIRKMSYLAVGKIFYAKPGFQKPLFSF